MRSKKPNSNTPGPLPYHGDNVDLNSRAKIAQAIAETRQKYREAETDEARWAAAETLELLGDERRRREQIIQKGVKTRRENKQAARFKRMGGQGEFSPLRCSLLIPSSRRQTRMIVRKSGAGCEAADTQRKKLLCKRRRKATNPSLPNIGGARQC
jgi:hypothetical protein